jgi:hypothetical protein
MVYTVVTNELAKLAGNGVGAWVRPRKTIDPHTTHRARLGLLVRTDVRRLHCFFS